MADRHHLQMLERGVHFWNDWRASNAQIIPDLSGANLSNQNLADANLSRTCLENAQLSHANLCNANLNHAHLCYAQLDHARLSQAKLLDADLSYANLKNAWLNDSNLVAANLFRANMREANLINARLSGAILIGTHLQGANLMGCAVQSTFAWGVKLKGANQTNLVVNHPEQPRIIVDQLEIAQLVHLRLYKQNGMRRFDTLPAKIVVLLGRFSKERSLFLQNIQELVRLRGYVPLKVDCDLETTPDYAVLSALIDLASMFIVDLTEPCNAVMALQHFELPKDKMTHLLMQASLTASGAVRLAQCFPQKFCPPMLYENDIDLRLHFDTEILPLPDDDSDASEEQSAEEETALPV